MNKPSTLISQRFTPQTLTSESPDHEHPHPTDPDAMISEAQRNARFKILKKMRQNKKCCDCNAKFPQWASASFGILICMNCSGKHRFLGPNVSFVRSIAMDNWKEREMRAMEIGGNKRFKAYLEEEMVEGELDYKSEVLQRYKRDLAKEVDAAFGSLVSSKEQKGEEKKTVEIKEKKEPIEEKKERKVSLTINKEDVVEEKKSVKPLEEQSTKVVMAESKQKSGNSESTGGKKNKKRNKNKKFAGKRIKKVDLNKLVTDDLEVETKTSIKKQKLFTDVKEDQIKETKEESSTNIIKKSSNNFLPSQKLETKLKTSKIKKYSGFGSDNMGEEATRSEQMNISQGSSMGFGAFGGYGSDDLAPKKVPSTEAGNGRQQGSGLFLFLEFISIEFWHYIPFVGIK